MPSFDDVLEYYRSLDLRSFSSLDRLILHQDTQPDGALTSICLEIELLSSIDQRTLHLAFFGVSQLKIQPSRSFIQPGPINITPIREYQWEGLRYLVSAQERDELSFYCYSFEANFDSTQPLYLDRQ